MKYQPTKNRFGLVDGTFTAMRKLPLMIVASLLCMSCTDNSKLSAQGICPEDKRIYSTEQKMQAVREYVYQDYLKTTDQIRRNNTLRFHSYVIDMIENKYQSFKPTWDYESNFLILLDNLNYDQFMDENKNCCNIVKGFPSGIEGLLGNEEKERHEKNLSNYIVLKYDIKYLDKQKKMQSITKRYQLGVSQCAKVSETNGFDKPYKF